MDVDCNNHFLASATSATNQLGGSAIAVPAGGSAIVVMEFMKIIMEFKVKFKTINNVGYKNWSDCGMKRLQWIIWSKG